MLEGSEKELRQAAAEKVELWTVASVLQSATAYLNKQQADSPRLDSEWMLASALGLDRLQLYLNLDRPLSVAERDAFKVLLRRRGAREPLAYILGQKGFWLYDFYVNKDVLIPRPETELLVECALEWIKSCSIDPSQLRILDIATGSGCIGICLAKSLPLAQVLAVDYSPLALGVAEKNVSKHLTSNVTLAPFDLHEKNSYGNLQPVHLIVSNPPYIKREEVPRLMPEVAAFEPVLALDGGLDGLDAYRSLAEYGAIPLARDGLFLVELGADQAVLVEAIFTEFSWTTVLRRRDLAGHLRVLGFSRSEVQDRMILAEGTDGS
jgi:release factor glutamine methyltransferase